MTKEKREFLGNYGDVSWIEHGGLFLFETQYGFEAHKIEPCAEYSNDNIIDDIYDPEMYWEIHRFDLDKLFYKENELVDEHDHKEWFSGNLDSISSCCGTDKTRLVVLLVSENPVDRLMGYQMIGDSHGFVNLDSYPLKVKAKDLKEMYNDIKGLCDLDLRRCKKAKKE